MRRSVGTSPSSQGCSNIFERLQLHADGMVYRYLNDPELTLVYCSAVCRELTGFNADDLIGRSYRSLRFGGSAAENPELALCEIKPSQEYVQRYLLKAEDGTVVEVVDYAYGVFDASDRLVAIEGILLASDAAIAPLPNRQTSTTDHVAIIRVDLDGRILACDEILLHTLGYYSNEIINSKWIELYTPTCQINIESHLADPTHCASQPLVQYLVSRNGKTIAVQQSIEPFQENDTFGFVIKILLPAAMVWADVDIHQHRLAMLIAAINLPCVLNTPNQRITHLNAAFTEAFGYTASDIPDLPHWWEQAYPDLSYRDWVTKEWLLHIEHASQTGSVFEPLQVRVRCKSGQVKSVSASATPLDDDWGGILLVTLTDLSAHEIQQQERLERELRYHTLFDSANISLWNEDLSALMRRLEQLRESGVNDLAAYFDSNPGSLFEFIELFKVVDVNRATERLFGAPKAVLLAGIGQLFGPGALDVLRAELLSFWERKPHFSAEVNLLTVDRRPIRAIVSFQIPRTIEAASTVPVSIQDLSVTQALQNELALRGEILENIQQGVYLIRALDGVIVYINPTLTAIFACDEQYLLGKHFSVLCEPGMACEASTAEMAASLKATGHWNGELLCQRSNTGVFWAHVTISSFNDAQHGLVWVSVLRDIDAEYQTLRALAVSNRQLLAIAKIQGDFIENQNERVAFDTVLDQICQITESAFGFAAEVLLHADGSPYLRINALSALGADASFYDRYAVYREQGLELHQLDHVLGIPLVNNEVLICNQVAASQFSEQILAEHPNLERFMVVPVLQGGQSIGMIGVANRASDYDQGLIQSLQPILLTYSQLIMAQRSKRDFRKASEALRERDQLWKTAIEGAGHGVWDWDIEQNKISFTETWANLLGYHLAELSDDPQLWQERIHDDDRKHSNDVLQRHLNGDSSHFSAEHRMRCKDGSYKWLLGRGTVLHRAEDGAPLRMIGTDTDISQRKSAEEALLANRAQLAGMIDSAMDAIVTTDSNFNIILFNRAAEQMFGYPAYKMLGCPIEALIPTRQAVAHRGLMHQFANKGDHTRKMTGRSVRQVMGLRSDGTEFPVEVSISFSENYGNPIYTAMVRDITDRKEYEENMLQLTATLEERVKQRTQELETARLQAESANRAKSAFVANMSHEIRTPLNSVLGMAHLAQQTELNAKQRDYLEKISSSGNHLLGLINDILDFSKIEAGKLELDLSDFSLNCLLNEIKDIVEPKALEKDLSFEVSLSSEVPRNIHGDALRIKQVLLNLLTNAVKFTEHGKVQLLVTQGKTAKDEHLTYFCVRDTGIGISPGAQTRLFQSFQQADNSTTRKYGGSGLGLAISRQLVNLMGGELQLNSQLHHGSEFSFAIALPVADAALEPVQPKQDHPLDYASLLTGKSVLLVDDHPFNQQVGEEFLREVGIEVVIANDGRQAIDLVKKQSFDAVLMDVQMPEMDGFTACQILRSFPEYDGLPILAMTANVSSENRQRCLDAGMNDFIGKPIQAERLYHALAYWLGCIDAEGAQIDTPTLNEMDNHLIDLQVLESMLGGNIDRQRKYLAKFAAAMQEGLQHISQLWQNNASQKIPAECHRLKSIARTVGATKLGDLLESLDTHHTPIDSQVASHTIASLQILFENTQKYLHEQGLLDSDQTNQMLQPITTGLDPNLRIMLIDDDEFTLELLSQHLSDLSLVHVTRCLDGHAALAQLEQLQQPDWILCDLQMPDMDGVAFLRLLGQKNYRGQVAILSGMDSTVLKATEKLGKSFQLNIHGALSKPVKKADLARLLTEDKLNTEQLSAASLQIDTAILDLVELQRGLAENAVELYYQPKVRTSDHRVVGAECLARWRHPTRGLLNPSLFVPAIEQLGLIDDLTFTVLRQAVQQLKQWQDSGESIKLSVNVSMDNLHRLELPELFAEVLEQNGIAAESITLEITETQLSHDYVLSLDILTRLRIKGFGLSIDDFGTGFSTMEHLLQTPFTELKIDQAFVRGASANQSAQTILEHSVMLGTKFKLNLVAEGVETQEDWDLVVSAGCHEVQGYLIAKPMPADEFIAWKQVWEQQN
ncbi:EAL domain-containing protein [Chitinibacter fontanus]|uniref:Virulence sensor protein BvgS n=1 Tax=Chitinibacter fontanus TaxID=1737446 RepID=A0A7D5Z6N0_9NEIS|nr:EAL domain-containing protein [Chitinibacter fontanus]QLI82981.1 EAL domain-containing protein [Chitinibacter fontanus]